MVQVSIFTSTRAWWRQRHYREHSLLDVFPNEQNFTAGRATLLTAGDGIFEAIARGGRRGRASTFDDNIWFSETQLLDPPISADDLKRAVRPRSRAAAVEVFKAGFGLLTETASADIRSWLVSHRPDASSTLEKILQVEPSWMGSPLVAAQFRIESDAVNVALEIAGFDREQALEGYLIPTEPEHFTIDQLTQVGEDAIVIDDADIFPGWDQVSKLRPAGRVFEDPVSGRRLTVLHANKNPIERTSGADLLYFVHQYKAFTLVQYKLARREGDRLVVRLDDQLDREEIRMSRVEASSHRSPKSAPELLDYRLGDSMCFFKLCEVDQPRQITGLSQGKYIDLGTWRLMADARVVNGPRGGRLLLYEGVDRYFTNSIFAELVSEGWVGSRSVDFTQLMDYVAHRYEAGKSLILGSLNLGRTLRRPRGDTDLLSRSISAR